MTTTIPNSCDVPGRNSACTLDITPTLGSLPWIQTFVLQIDSAAIPAGQASALGSIVAWTDALPGEANTRNNQVVLT